MTDIGRLTSPSWEPIDWDARLRVAVEQTLTARLARLDQRNASTRARNHGLAATENRGTSRPSVVTPDRVSKPCQPPATPQLTDLPPDPQTGENNHRKADQ